MGIEHLSDEAIFLRVCQGEKELYRILFDRYNGSMARVIMKMTGNTHELEDLVADVFLTAYQKKNQFRQAGSFKSWLYTIAVNTARQYIRKQRFRRQVMTDFIVAKKSVHSPADPAAKSLEKLESRELIMGCLSKVRPKLRAVFVLRDLEGMSYEEIAEILGCPVGTVKSRLNAARKTVLKLARESLNSRGV